jgi:hypothetical protein
MAPCLFLVPCLIYCWQCSLLRIILSRCSIFPFVPARLSILLFLFFVVHSSFFFLGPSTTLFRIFIRFLNVGRLPKMYHSLILSFFLAPILGLALPTTAPWTGTNTAPTGNIVSGGALLSTQHGPKINSLSNVTNILDTINYFPDPEVHCSGRHLYDETTNWRADLTAAVTTATQDGIYGTCDAGRSEVDGSGNLAWRSGRVQVYYCNKGFMPNPCSVNEYWRADE